MNIKKLVFKIIIISLLMVFVQRSYGQTTDTADLISVNIHLISEGTPRYVKEAKTESYYFVMATIENKQDTAIHFYVMTCSWPGDNWRVDNKGIFFWYPGCDSNIPDRIDLLPHQSINFKGVLACEKKLANRSFKAGFIYCSTWLEIWNALGRAHDQSLKTYWTKPMVLEDHLFNYEKD